ncbi:MAG: hypothetical protein ACXACI_13860 [Candidatus Hodarchaeales archaeon]|jgi:hypothetical protein
MTTKKSECDILVEESEQLLTISLKQAAEMFYAAAECYDSAEEKKLAARYYTLAGQSFFDLNTRRAMRKAAAAYGKAITRYLIVDDLQGATFLLEKGKKQEFDTYHFKMAEDALERKISDLELATPELELIEEAPKSEIVLPKIVPLAEPLEVPSEITDILIDYEEVKPVLESFTIEDQIDEISDDVGRALLENVSETFKYKARIIKYCLCCHYFWPKNYNRAPNDLSTFEG